MMVCASTVFWRRKWELLAEDGVEEAEVGVEVPAAGETNINTFRNTI